jgi:hypothetical protein
VINDKEDGSTLASSQLDWQIATSDGSIISKGKLDIPSVGHYMRYWVDPKIIVPSALPQPKVNGKLVLRLSENGKVISENDYELIFADNSSLETNRLAEKKIAVVDFNKGISPALDNIKINYTHSASVSDALKQKADVYVLCGVDSVNTSAKEISALRTLVTGGAKVLLTNSGNFGHLLYPEYIRDAIKSNGEVVTMDIPESDIFDGLEPLDTRNFNNNERELPAVTSGAYRINRSPNVEALASFTKIHGYLSGGIEERTTRLDKIKGFPIVKIKDKGSVILSEMMLNKAATDPIAGRLLVNYLSELCK